MDWEDSVVVEVLLRRVDHPSWDQVVAVHSPSFE